MEEREYQRRDLVDVSVGKRVGEDGEIDRM